MSTNTYTPTAFAEGSSDRVARIDAAAAMLRGDVSMRNFTNPLRPFAPADRLPPPARAKLEELRQAAQDAHALIPPITERRRDAADKRSRIRMRWTTLTDPTYAVGSVAVPKHGPLTAALPSFDGTEDNALVQCRLEFAQASAEFDKLGELERTRAERWNALAAVVANLDNYLAGTSTELTLYSGPEPSPRRGETAEAGLTRVRKSILKAQNDLILVQRAPLPASMVKAALRKQIDALADANQANCIYMIESGDPLEFPAGPSAVVQTAGVVPSTKEVVHGIGHVEMPPSALGMIVWLFKDEVLARLDAEIDKRADEGAALDPEQRAMALAEARAALLALEREEEWLIEASPSSVFRRPDADPRAVLGVDGPEARQ